MARKTIGIRPVGGADVRLFHRLSCEMIARDPECFNIDPERGIHRTISAMRLSRMVREPDSAGFIANYGRDRGVAGIVLCGVDPRVTIDGLEGPVAVVESFYVRDCRRRMGIGSSLLAAATGFLGSRVEHVALHVASANERAARYYLGLGFEYTGWFHPWWNGDPEKSEQEMVAKLDDVQSALGERVAGLNRTQQG